MNYRLNHYVIRDGVVVAEPDEKKFREWLETFNLQLFRDHSVIDGSDVIVSTVFVPCVIEYEKPYFEAMIFGGPHHGRYARCEGSLEQAEALHVQTCQYANLKLISEIR